MQSENQQQFAVPLASLRVTRFAYPLQALDGKKNRTTCRGTSNWHHIGCK